MTPKVILVTGASSGIGAACAQTLARAGHHVIAASRSGTVTAAPPDALGNLVTRRLDIRDVEAIHHLIAHITDAFGRLDAVVNAAGIAVAGPLEDTPISVVQAQIETNLLGAIYLLRASVPILRRAAPSKFVHVSSIAAHVPLPYQALYCASHAAVGALCESLRYELAPQGVYVSLLEAGSVNTQITEHRLTSSSNGSVVAEKALRINDEDERKGVPADDVAQVITRLLLLPNPPLRQPVGHWHERAMIPMRRILPAHLFQKIIRSHFGLRS